MQYDILREEWLNNLPQATIDTYQQMSNEICEVIIKRINAIGKLSKTDIIRLTNSIQYYGADINEIEKIIAKYTKMGKSEIDKIFQDVALKNDEFAKQFYKYRNMTPLNALDDAFLKEQIYFIKEQTKAFTGQNLSNTLAFKGLGGGYVPIRQAYKQYIDRAIYEIQGGTIDYNTAMKKAIRNLSQGVDVVKWNTIIGTDENGNPIYYHRRLDSSVRQNILDGVKQANQQIMDYHGKQFQADGIELTAHAISAPDHAPVQGRQFSNDDFDRMQSGLDFLDYKGNHYDGFERPIGQWNCRHFAIPIVLGISQPVYTEKQLQEMEQNSAEKYPIKQKQREYERYLRELKEQYKVLKETGNNEEAAQLKKQINAKQKEYRIFSKVHQVEYEPERARVY